MSDASSAAIDPAAQTIIDTVSSGYGFNGPCLELGAVVVDGTAYKEGQVRVPLTMMNRHGLVAGATGTGKTKTLQLMAEQLSANGVPVFLADIKGDLTGLATQGTMNDRISQRTSEIGQDWEPRSYPLEFLTLGSSEHGVPVRATMTSFGPILLSRVLGLNQTQESSLQLVFHYADKNGLLLLDLKDLKSVVSHLCSDEGKKDLEGLGGLSKATAGVILRELTTFEAQGLDQFFGEEEFDTANLLRLDPQGRGVISCLELPSLQNNPEVFSTFLMWLLADLFESLPEVGDIDKPKLVFFFDEAHLLFNGASKAFLQAITQTVRLIRSKGVGVFFVTQTPKDVPTDVLAQLGNRVQHALRAFTPDDAKALKSTVGTFPRSGYDLEQVLQQCGIGEAVVTVLSDKGAPTPVAWTRLTCPETLMGPSDPAWVKAAIAHSSLMPLYGEPVDRHSAYEMLQQRLAQPSVPAAEAQQPYVPGPTPPPPGDDDFLPPLSQGGGGYGMPAPTPAPRSRAPRQAPAPRQQPSAMDTAIKTAATVAVTEIIRGMFGNSRRKRR